MSNQTTNSNHDLATVQNEIQALNQNPALNHLIQELCELTRQTAYQEGKQIGYRTGYQAGITVY